MVETLQPLVASLADRGAAPALSRRTEFRTFRHSYADLAREVRSAAAWLVAHGVGPGERILLWAPNSPAWATLFLASLASGVVAVPLDLHSAPDFVERVAAETEPRLIVHGRFPVAKQLARRAIRLDALAWEIGQREGGRAPQGPASSFSWPAIRPSDLAEIVYTSGTTSRPRGVMLTQANLAANLRAIQPIVPPEPFYRFLSLLPLSHVFEQVVGLLLPLSRGGAITYLTTLKPSSLQEALRDERPNVLVTVPRLLELLRARVEAGLPSPVRAARDLAEPVLLALPFEVRRALFGLVRQQLGGALRYLVVGGAPLRCDLERFWDSLGILVLQGYGLTEAGPTVAANTPAAHRLCSVGRPLGETRVRIGRDGEILAAGPGITPGYFCHPELTRAAFVDGFLRTGDLGRFDRDGFLYVLGRQKDVIVTSAGLKVYPEDVERALNRQPGVRDSVVLEWQGQVFAVLLLDPRFAVSPAEVVERANRQLNPVQRIHGWSVWPEADFPRTPTLKVQTYLVRDELTRLTGLAPRSVAGERGHPPTPRSPVGRVVADFAPTHPVTPTTRLGPDLDLSSIDRLELIALLEEEFRVDLPEDQITGETTVGELEALVQRAPRQVPPHWRTWPLARPIVTLRDWLERGLVFPLLCRLVRISVEGRERLAGQRGPVLLAGNHLSHLDALIVLAALPAELRRRVAVAALAGFYFPPPESPLLRFLHGALFDLASLVVNVFPVPRATGFRESLRFAGYLVDHGWSVLIFPEGTRSPSGAILPFREGIGLLAVELDVPVLPFRLRGSQRILPVGAWLPRPGPVHLRFGRPLCLGPSSPEEATQLIQQAVEAL